MSIEDDKVAAKAYELWEKEGRPQGRDQEHWFKAQEAVAAAKPERAAKPAAAKPEATRAAAKGAAAKAPAMPRARKPAAPKA